MQGAQTACRFTEFARGMSVGARECPENHKNKKCKSICQKKKEENRPYSQFCFKRRRLKIIVFSVKCTFYAIFNDVESSRFGSLLVMPHQTRAPSSCLLR